MIVKSHLEIIEQFVVKNQIKEFADFVNQNEIPVFIHIPKCGGTYVRGSFFLLNKFYCMYCKNLPQNKGGAIFITDKSKEPFALIYVTQNPTIANPKFVMTENIYRMSTNEFLKYASSGYFYVFAVAITSVVIKDHCQEQLSLILDYLKTLYKIKLFISIRDPFERAKSLYYVHKARNTQLECFNSEQPCVEEFSKFLSSHYSEPNWISMFLSYIFKQYTFYDFNKHVPIIDTTYELLTSHLDSSVDIVTLPNITKYASEMLSNIYFPSMGNLLFYYESIAPSIAFNSTIKAIDFSSEDVDVNSLAAFKLNSKYDFLLFEQANLINKL